MFPDATLVKSPPIIIGLVKELPKVIAYTGPLVPEEL